MGNQAPSTVKKVLAAIRAFEEDGREVIGVSIKGSEFKLDLAKESGTTVEQVDLVTMRE